MLVVAYACYNCQTALSIVQAACVLDLLETQHIHHAVLCTGTKLSCMLLVVARCTRCNGHADRKNQLVQPGCILYCCWQRGIISSSNCEWHLGNQQAVCLDASKWSHHYVHIVLAFHESDGKFAHGGRLCNARVTNRLISCSAYNDCLRSVLNNSLQTQP